MMNNPNDSSAQLAEPGALSARPTPSASKPNEQFLQEPTLAFLESCSNHLRPALSSGIFVLSLAKLQLNSIGDIGQFQHLQICDLSSNFIESIDDLLVHCRSLIKLDLHSNRINRLPDGELWKELIHLKLLYLHDNLLSSYDDVRSLASASTVEVLTLYDTPLSLKKNYRHHVVNSVWSLKALDTHVIADDEIIEKTRFPEPYTAHSGAFKINLHLPTGKNSTLNAERQAIAQLSRQINKIQAHFCPVLILQKNFRMWLVRNQLANKLLSTTRLLPKFIRGRKTYSPASGSSGLFSLLPRANRASAVTDDYYRIEPLKTPDSYPDKRHVLVQLNSSQTENIRLPYFNDGNTRSRPMAPKTSTSKYSDDRSSPILRGQKSQMTIYEPIEELNDEIRVARQYVQNLKDESHMKQRKRAAEIKENKTANRQTVRHHTLDDRLLRTLHGSMAFGCLVAIDKAYNDREKIEQRKQLTHEVEQARQEHSFITAQIQHIDDERLMNIHRGKDHDRMKQTYHRHRLEHNQDEVHDLVQEQRQILLAQQKKRRAQIAFSQTFNAQHISISNALQRHETTVRAQRKARHARDSVARQKQTTEEQARLIEKYLTQRKHVRRALSNIERKQLDIQTMRDAGDRFLQAQQRVAHIRARETNVRHFSLMKMASTDEEAREKAQSLTESVLERESLFETIADHMASQQLVQ